MSDAGERLRSITQCQLSRVCFICMVPLFKRLMIADTCCVSNCSNARCVRPSETLVGESPRTDASHGTARYQIGFGAFPAHPNVGPSWKIRGSDRASASAEPWLRSAHRRARTKSSNWLPRPRNGFFMLVTPTGRSESWNSRDADWAARCAAARNQFRSTSGIRSASPLEGIRHGVMSSAKGGPNTPFGFGRETQSCGTNVAPRNADPFRSAHLPVTPASCRGDPRRDCAADHQPAISHAVSARLRRIL